MTETIAKAIRNKTGATAPTGKAARTIEKNKRRARQLAPRGVPRYIRVYDNGGMDAPDGSADRYTVIFTGRYSKGEGYNKEFDYLAMSGAPYHPQGIGIHGSTKYQPADTIEHKPGGGWKWPPAIGRKCHLGRRITFAELPEDCRTITLNDYCELWTLDLALVRGLESEARRDA